MAPAGAAGCRRKRRCLPCLKRNDSLRRPSAQGPPCVAVSFFRMRRFVLPQ
ncbi:hypothetical protein HMPREF0239_00795 [Clostridium sp. ATCC BAA-442]|nr:hypothetical protein HMPREF0239_00795 [Clostridium sp. ATCC BAA-442]